MDPQNALPNHRSIGAYRYKPHNLALEPYWNAFYENPYPSTEESLETVHRWYEQARGLAHVLERGSSCETQTQDDDDHNKVEKVRTRGPLDSYFGKRDEQPSKRERSARDGVSRTENMETKKAEITYPRGPRGKYTKQSPTTLWRHQVHAQKYASDIQPFFRAPTESAEECIVVKDEPNLEVIASGSDDRAGSSESSGRGKV